MKIFIVGYEGPGFRGRGTHVVCEKSEDIVAIIAERHDTVIEKIQNLGFREVSPEQVSLKELTVADFLRLTK